MRIDASVAPRELIDGGSETSCLLWSGMKCFFPGSFIFQYQVCAPQATQHNTLLHSQERCKMQRNTPSSKWWEKCPRFAPPCCVSATNHARNQK